MVTNKLTINSTELLAATRYYRKEPNITKTCKTCKHWGAVDTVRTGESINTSIRKCEEIFKRITASDPEIASCFPFSAYFKTDASFGCNGYQQINNENNQ